MYLHSLATAVPERVCTQAECWDIVERSPRMRERLHRRSRLVLRSILRGDNGIERRHFAVPEVEHVFDLTADELNAAFRQAAPPLAGRALAKALDEAKKANRSEELLRSIQDKLDTVNQRIANLDHAGP